ncbi:MAG: hypothetical protein A2341_27465 [Deltaproteobacteria bacterium RIFOXYB12_FULL_58_9]|nr:MAG: hypothetical protein A2341_27465 [Deltaproteobacteria bacterium RIFOXYB12_FULL_58_9]
MSHLDREGLQAPEPIRISMGIRAAALIAVLIGAGAFFWALRSGHETTAWSAYLIGAFYALGLGVFGIMWMSILYLAKGVWSVSMRRIPEAMAGWLLPGCILVVLVAVGGHHLYHWTDAAAVAIDELLQHKEPFLNATTFNVLMTVSFIVWLAFAFLMLRNSRKQDVSGRASLSHANIRLSAMFVVLFAITFSIVSYYLLMSLEAHWFSTIYVVLTFTDLLQTGTAFVAVVVSVLIIRGRLLDFVNENHLHSLVKMMFATTGFWAYIYFCQFLLIWYTNIPEETAHFVARWENGWLPYLIALPILKFVVPFIVLIPREAKRKPLRVLPVAVLILFAQFWELFVLVSPATGHGGHMTHGHAPWIELAVTGGFIGLFVLVFVWSLGRNNAVPIKDPRIGECLHYHQ